jgi:hypothetical protein
MIVAPWEATQTLGEEVFDIGEGGGVWFVWRGRFLERKACLLMEPASGAFFGC